MQKNLELLLVSVVVFFGACVFGEPGTLLVPSEHSTIQSGIDSAANGDTVIVATGTYTENIDFGGKAITVRSENPDDPGVVKSTILSGVGAGSVVTFANSEGADSVLSGFKISGGTGTLNDSLGSSIYWGAGVYCWEASPTIKNNIINGNNGLSNNVYGGGIGCYNSEAIIVNNIFLGNSAGAGGAILVIGGDTKIRNNLIYGNSADTGGGVVLMDGQLVGNTLCYNSAQAGGNVYVDRYSAEGKSIVTSNIIARASSSDGIYWELAGGYENISYNNIWNNGSGDYSSVPDQTGLNGNVSVDPLFTALGSHEYNLKQDSPCINGGDPDFIVLADERDIDGDQRVYAGRVDIGADEYIGILKPRADAGKDQVVTVNGSLVTLDGIGSYFTNPEGVKEYSWSQISGPVVALSDDTAVSPTFSVYEYGVYVFELVVSDGEYVSLPDTVTVANNNLIPVSDAGEIQRFKEIPDIVTLDGSGSLDSNGHEITYRWRQTEGPIVKLSDNSIDSPSFVPAEFGVYKFELIVNDGFDDSAADLTGVVIGNSTPIADAGLDRYAATQAVLDGSGSYDPDFYETITYNWTQVSGPGAVITGADTATPTVSGFTQTTSIQECVFQLVVSDGDKDSIPDTVKVKIVPSFGENTLELRNPFFDPGKPTIVAFSGGNCNTGGSMSFGGLWEEKVNWITTSYGKPYTKYADMLIVYLSSVAPDYKEPIQTMGFSTGNMPAIDVANRLNSVYSDARYAVNRVSLLDAACRNFQADIDKFVNNPVAGEQCWIDSYIATHSRYYSNVLKITFPGGSHGDPVYWYADSIYESSHPVGDMYNDGIMAGYYYSVAGPGKNLQLASDESKYYFKWINSDPDYFTFYNQSLYPGRLPEAVTLAGPGDGDTLDAGGDVLSCQVSRNVVNYKLLMGPDPYNMEYVISDTAVPPEDVITVLPYETTYWTVKATDMYGSTIFADPIRIQTSGPLNPISNPFGREYLDLIDYELLWEKQVSATVSEYCFKMKVKNVFMPDAENVTVKIGLAPDNITVINDKVFFTSLPGGQEVSCDDTFIIRIDHSAASDENDLVWEISDEVETHLSGDIDRDFSVGLSDLEVLANNWLGSYMSEGLSGYWALGENSGRIIGDLSGNGNDGVIRGTPGTADGVTGKALSFDGDDYVIANGICDDIAGGDFTLSLWIKSDSTTSQEFIASFNTIAGDNRLLIGHPAGNSNLCVHQGVWKYSESAVFDGGWHHIAFILDNAANQIRLYVDGNMVLEESLSCGISADDLFSLGHEYDPGPVASDFYTGLIDDAAIYNRVHSPEEIRQLYNNPESNPKGDVNQDAIIDMADLAEIAKNWQMQK